MDRSECHGVLIGLADSGSGLAAKLSKQIAYPRVPLQCGAMVAAFLQYETFVISVEPRKYAARCIGVVLRVATGGKGRRGGQQQNFLCEYPLTSRPGVGNCDGKPTTKLKLGVGGSGAKLERARTTPAAGAGKRSTQREPWEAAPRSADDCRV